MDSFEEDNLRSVGRREISPLNRRAIPQTIIATPIVFISNAQKDIVGQFQKVAKATPLWRFQGPRYGFSAVGVSESPTRSPVPDRQLESSVRFNSFQAKPDGPGSVPPETRGRPSRSNFRATLKARALEASKDGFWTTVDSSRSSALRRRRGIEKPPQETFAPLQLREQETLKTLRGAYHGLLPNGELHK